MKESVDLWIFMGIACTLSTFFLLSCQSHGVGIVDESEIELAPVSWNVSASLGTERDEYEDIPNNAPLFPCGPAGGVEDGQYIELLKQYMNPVCENVQGYCRLKRNQNYTAVLRYIPKVRIESLTVKVTLVQPGYGWETSFWPEYGACGRFNISCPQGPNGIVNANNTDKVPDEVPPTRGLIRLRLLGTSIEDDTKKPYICRQIYLQFY